MFVLQLLGVVLLLEIGFAAADVASYVNNILILHICGSFWEAHGPDRCTSAVWHRSYNQAQRAIITVKFLPVNAK